jgi:hypothetical protein
MYIFKGGTSVGDLYLFKDKVVALPKNWMFISPSMGSELILRYRSLPGGISIHSVNGSLIRSVGGTGGSEGSENKCFSHEILQEGTVTCVATERMGIYMYIYIHKFI